MITPKISACNRAINWLNQYIAHNQNSKLPSTICILAKIKKKKIDCKSINNSPIEDNSWLSGFTDYDGNFSINIHKRSDKNITSVQLFYRLEIRQNYLRKDNNNFNLSFFPIMYKIGLFLGAPVYSRSRILKDKIFYSFIVMAQNSISKSKVIDYFEKYPLLSSKYLDYKDWKCIFYLQNSNNLTSYYLDKALLIIKFFNSKRNNDSVSWDHLNDCYLLK